MPDLVTSGSADSSGEFDKDKSSKDTGSSSGRPYLEKSMSFKGNDGHWDMGRIMKGVIFALAVIMMILSVFGLYFTIQDIINKWVIRQFVPIVMSVFYLGVIVLAVYVMNLYTKRH